MGIPAFWQSRKPIWGRRPELLTLRFDEDLDLLLHPGHGVSVVEVRPARGREHLAVERVRRENADWLGEWEATVPPDNEASLPTWNEFARFMDQRQRAGQALSMMIVVDGEIAGLVSVGAVERGAMQLGVLGYWIAQKWAGKGITSLAVAATIDLVLSELGLHRLEVNVRPENVASLGLMRKLRLREEGYKPRYMHINGRWADHIGFAVDREDLIAMPRQSVVQSRLRASKGREGRRS